MKIKWNHDSYSKEGRKRASHCYRFQIPEDKLVMPPWRSHPCLCESWLLTVQPTPKSSPTQAPQSPILGNGLINLNECIHAQALMHTHMCTCTHTTFHCHPYAPSCLWLTPKLQEILPLSRAPGHPSHPQAINPLGWKPPWTLTCSLWVSNGSSVKWGNPSADMTTLWEKTRAIEIKMLVHHHLHTASLPGVLLQFSWVSHCFLLWVPGNAYPLGISSSTGNPLESQVYLPIPPLSLTEQCLGVGHRPKALPSQRWYQSHSKPPPKRRLPQQAWTREDRGLMGDLRQVSLRLVSSFTNGKPTSHPSYHLISMIL